MASFLGCYGDGGAIFSDNDEWADLIRSFRIHGKGADKYDNVRVGMNSRLDTMQTALKEKGIPSMFYYPKAMHEQDAVVEVVKGDMEWAGLYETNT